MRHALIRFLTALDVDAAWYVFFLNSFFVLCPICTAQQPHVPISALSSPNLCAFFSPARLYRRYVPNPSPSVFRVTKNNHNILQGVAPPDLRLTQGNKDIFDAWILKNGLRWTAEGGPLTPGGVDIAFIGPCFMHMDTLLHQPGLTRGIRRPTNARTHSSDQKNPPRTAYHLPFAH